MAQEVPVIAPVRLTVEARTLVELRDRSTTTLRLFVRQEAEKRAISPDLAEAVVQAESSFDWMAQNASSTASGLFQFINGTFLAFCSKDLTQKNDPIIQTDCALKMIADGGLHHWDASRSKWEKAL